MDSVIENKDLIFKSFRGLTEDERKIIGDSWANPFNARYNYMKDPYGSVEELSALLDPTFENIDDYYDCMWFKVVTLESTGEIVGTCRYGMHHSINDKKVWGFGFNVLLKYWHKGFGVEILRKIIEIAKSQGVTRIIGGADKENYGSYKVMVRNGFVYNGLDEDGDYSYILDLKKEPITSNEMNHNWNEHLLMTKNDFGVDKFQRLEYVNNKILEMIRRIQDGENEVELVKEYFEKLNEIDEFPFS